MGNICHAICNQEEPDKTLPPTPRPSPAKPENAENLEEEMMKPTSTSEKKKKIESIVKHIKHKDGSFNIKDFNISISPIAKARKKMQSERNSIISPLSIKKLTFYQNESDNSVKSDQEQDQVNELPPTRDSMVAFSIYNRTQGLFSPPPAPSTTPELSKIMYQNNLTNLTGRSEKSFKRVKSLQIMKVKPSHFEFIQSLGSGSHGKVLLARKKRNKQLYAIKVLNTQKIKDFEKFKNEMNVLITADHPFIIKLEQVFQDGKFIYVCLELVKGGKNQKINVD